MSPPTASPYHTSRQTILASGSTLNIAANRSVETTNETAETSSRDSPIWPGMKRSTRAETISETTRMKCIDPTTPTESSRLRSQAQIPDFHPPLLGSDT